jgi:hypothetical protein
LGTDVAAAHCSATLVEPDGVAEVSTGVQLCTFAADADADAADADAEADEAAAEADADDWRA